MNPALWAGVECTINRVGDRHFDQLLRNGHRHRIEDLDLFASLGLERLRYPFLWESVAPDREDRFDWSWCDERISRLKALGIEPIVGLLHHGSGPRYTSLLDPEFPRKFARYAAAFARRYPDLRYYTPINEPLTTARFSALYGVWYPHARDDRSFVRALYNQVKGTVFAMHEIREVNPEAKLIQTEDLGRASSTPALAYQAEFENERRWSSFDLLSGRVGREHAMSRFFLENGLDEFELEWLRENPCAPDVLGINHYLLSSRFLDDRLELYPVPLHGGNRRDRYADVGAIDAASAVLPSVESILKEVWERYRLPIAVTEVHTSGTPESRLRWFREVWDAARALNGSGARVEAVTAWSLLGSFDWNTLCTNGDDCRFFYEPGVYDVRGPTPRPTVIAEALKGLKSSGEILHPLARQPGWWRTPKRILFGERPSESSDSRSLEGRPILITGANGTLGRAFAKVCQHRDIPFVARSRQELDITDREAVEREIAALRPWAVVNAAGFVNVDLAESERDRCFEVNVVGPETLAAACAREEVRFVTFSSDLVFDGARDVPYVESDPVSPLNEYGRSKAESEVRVLARKPDSLVVRTSSFFGPWDEHNFVTQVLRHAVRGTSASALSDVESSPTYVPDLVNASLDLLIDGVAGIVHLSNSGRVSWSRLARMTIEVANRRSLPLACRPDPIVERRIDEVGLAARRPRNSSLASERWTSMPSLEEALERYFNELEMGLVEAGTHAQKGA